MKKTKPIALQKPVVLVGMMGAGKSTIGLRLAEKLCVPFIDTDAEIVEAAGRSIPEIFEQFGEADFRDLEHRIISRLMNHCEPSVIATGGGAFLQERNRDLIQQHAFTIWLKADLGVLLDRVSRKKSRPLLEAGDKEEILKRLMLEREPVYALADVMVDSGSGEHDQVVDEMLKALQEIS